MNRLINWIKSSAERHPWWWRLGAIPVILGPTFLVIAFVQPPRSATSAPTGDDAALVCRGIVEERLKAPSTAEFSDLRYTGESPRWTVYGTVDAENSFGAKLRKHWTCVVRVDGGWQLESLTGL